MTDEMVEGIKALRKSVAEHWLNIYKPILETWVAVNKKVVEDGNDGEVINMHAFTFPSGGFTSKPYKILIRGAILFP